MFKNLMSFWKGKDFLTQVLQEFKEMLNDTSGMFESVCTALLEGSAGGGLKDKIYAVDKKVNLLEKDIRKRIVEHLAMHPSVNIPFSLVLMSVVKDAERIGDYCKNLFEVTELLEKPMRKDEYEKFFDGIDKNILGIFEKTRKAFIESDENVAKEILIDEKKVVKTCDEIVKKLAGSDLSTNKAVCFTLVARYFKRVAAHLVNIGSSVILPITDLDFFDEKLRHNKENA